MKVWFLFRVVIFPYWGVKLHRKAIFSYLIARTDLICMPRLIGLWILLLTFAETISQIVFMSTRAQSVQQCFRASCSQTGGRKTLHCAASGDDEPIISLHIYLFAGPISELRLSRLGQGRCVLSGMWTIKCWSTASTNQRPVSILLLPMGGRKIRYCPPAIH